MNLTPSQKFWKKHIESCQSSGLSQAQYCQKHGLKTGTFSGQKTHFKKLGILTSSSESTSVIDPFIAIKKDRPQPELSIELAGKIKIQFSELPDPIWMGQFLGEINASQA